MKYPGQIYTEKTIFIYLKLMFNQAPCILYIQKATLVVGSLDVLKTVKVQSAAVQSAVDDPTACHEVTLLPSRSVWPMRSVSKRTKEVSLSSSSNQSLRPPGLLDHGEQHSACKVSIPEGFPGGGGISAEFCRWGNSSGGETKGEEVGRRACSLSRLQKGHSS